MNTIQAISKDIYYVGGNDRRIALFENAYPVPDGMSYNSYLIKDEKTVLLDTVDHVISTTFLENVEAALDGRMLDYLIVNHMEPDHCAAIGDIISRYPDVQVVGNAKTMQMMKQFFAFDIDSRAYVVKEGDVLETGNHHLHFVMAPLVHWPEVMVTYDSDEKILFSADAFGTFGTVDGDLFADARPLESWRDEARRYYGNIVGKYGKPVQALLSKASKLDIGMICPLHGPILRKDLSWYLDLYSKWSNYTPEEDGVLIAYASIYGNTENAVHLLVNSLRLLGITNVKVYDVSATDPCYILSDAFRYSHLVFASPTYNGGIFSKMENLLMDIKAHNLQNRTVALIENGSWAPASARQMQAILDKMNYCENTVTIRSSVKEENKKQLELLAKEIQTAISYHQDHGDTAE